MSTKQLTGPILAVAVAVLCGCNSPTSPPAPEAARPSEERAPGRATREQEAAEAKRKAAAVEAEMNKNATSEAIAKKPAADEHAPAQ
jgi:hypothetical protein